MILIFPEKKKFEANFNYNFPQNFGRATFYDLSNNS